MHKHNMHKAKAASTYITSSDRDETGLQNDDVA